MDNILNLEELRKGCSGIMPSMGGFMVDAAIYSLASQGHQSGVTINVETDNEIQSFILVWEAEMDLQMQRTMNDENRSTDFAAMCLAVFFIFKLTNYKGFTASRRNTGVDFFLFNTEPLDLDVTKADARLEISGISKLSRTNTLETRYKQKQKQVKRSDFSGKEVYIFIIEFQQPSSIFKKNDEYKRIS